MEDSITVVTPTRQRIELLQRAITSVRKQDYKGIIYHYIIVDDCQETAAFLEGFDDPNYRLIWEVAKRVPGDVHGSRRVAKLRNHAVKKAQTEWIAFLDDDNEFKPNHLSSLIERAKHTGCSAVRSYRELYWADGRPYTVPRFPWTHDEAQGGQLYQELCDLGIFQPGSHVVREQIPSVGSSPLPMNVDTSEWLIKRELFLQYPFDTKKYDENDWPDGLAGRRQGEDDRFLWGLVNNRVPIACSELSTLKYYLGGYSNEL